MAIESFAAKTAVGRGVSASDLLSRRVTRLLGEVAGSSSAASTPRQRAHRVAVAAQPLARRRRCAAARG